MSIKNKYLSREACMHECYGKMFNEDDEDCMDCPESGDCETLSSLSRDVTHRRKVAKMPPIKEVKVEEEEKNECTDNYWNVPRVQHTPPDSWTSQPQSYVQPYQNQNPAQFTQPGMQCSAHIIQHPAPHLTYMVSNPVDCPMPIVGESWYARIGKNVLSGALSEGGRQIYEYFRRFRF